jgi:TPR repeat protein
MARYVWSSFEETQLTARSVEADTLLQMGLTYATGRNVEADLVAAHKWFNLAALKGSQRAKTYRMEIANEMDRKQLREAQRQAREWLRQH